MKTRVQELRERDGRVLRRALGVAALLHLAAFVLWPGYRVESPPSDPGARMKAVHGVAGTPTYVSVLFGPPDILEADGTVSSEPPERVLAADRILRLPTECDDLKLPGRTPVTGRVRVRVGTAGLAKATGLARSTGDPCADEVLATVADALRYLWLPSERFPAPVDLIQPVTLNLVSS
jgi:hypothetical protein